MKAEWCTPLSVTCSTKACLKSNRQASDFTFFFPSYYYLCVCVLGEVGALCPPMKHCSHLFPPFFSISTLTPIQSTFIFPTFIYFGHLSSSPPPPILLPFLPLSSYMVCVGLIDRLEEHFSSITGPIEDISTIKLVLGGLNLLVAITAFMHTRYVYCGCERKGHSERGSVKRGRE